jgi:dihydrofolate reductase
MGKITVGLSMSLDGFVAGPNDRPDNPLGDGGERLFAWYREGDSELALPGTDMVFHVPSASAEHLRAEWAKVGAMVAGRRMFDIAGAWGGHPPGGGNCFIMTHEPPQEWIYDGSPFTFVTDGIENAVGRAQQSANGKDVSIGSAAIAQQCLNAGLLDEIHIDLAPCVLGAGVRLFDRLGVGPVDLEIVTVVPTPLVTHLVYRVLTNRAS